MTGFISPEQGLDRLIETARQLRVSNADRLKPDGIYGPEFKAAIAELRLDPDKSGIFFRESHVVALMIDPKHTHKEWGGETAFNQSAFLKWIEGMTGLVDES